MIMTIKECYAAMNADFDDVMSRLLTEQRVSKFVLRFPGDTSHQLLLDSFAQGDIETAFRASHTLKGTAANMGFSPLFDKASAVCEDLRHGNPGSNIADMIAECTEVYNKTIAVINDYAANKED